MHKEEFSEKRKFVRFLIAIPLKYAKLSLKKFTDASTIDISTQGLGLIITEELPVNTPLNICLSMPDNGEEIPLDAEVVWSRGEGIGCYRSGLRLKDTQIKPIPLVLRTINSKL